METAAGRSSGFQLTLGPGPIAVWVESGRIPECMAFYRREGLTRIALSTFQGFHDNDIEFLKDYPEVRGVWLSDVDDVDLSGLRHLAGSLESLRIGNNKHPLDISQFPRLEEFRGAWHPKLSITSECRNLRVLSLRKLAPKSRDLTALPELPGLKELSVIDAPLQSIEGVGRFSHLERLELAHLTKLESIAHIGELKGGELRSLECEACRKITDHEAAAMVPSLRVLRFNDCGSIPSLRFLDDLPNLEEFRFVDTDVVDGDLRPVLRLRSVGFFKKRHYSHTPEEVDAIIAANRAG